MISCIKGDIILSYKLFHNRLLSSFIIVVRNKLLVSDFHENIIINNKVYQGAV